MPSSETDRLLSAALRSGQHAEEARREMLMHARTRQEAMLLLHESGYSVRGLARALRCSPAVVQAALRTARRYRHPSVLPRREEHVAFELHRAFVAKLLADPGPILALAKKNLGRSRGVVRGSQAQRWLDEWERLLDGPVEHLVTEILRTDEHGVDMRQVSPFAGALTQEERLEAIDRARANTA